MRLFLDANVLFTAAHNPRGKAAFVIELASRGHWEVVTSELAIEEAQRNLEAKFLPSVEWLLVLLLHFQQVQTPHGVACPIAIASKDVPIVLAALGSECTHLLTGDRRHFGRWMNEPDACRGLRIQTVADFLASL